MENIDLELTEGASTVPLGISFAYVLVVEYGRMFPRVALHLQSVCNDGEQITLLP